MTHPIQVGPDHPRPSPLFDSLLVFLGPPALGFEEAWADFQAAAGRSVAEGTAHPWWAIERELFTAITTPKDGNPPAAEELLSIVLGRPVHAAPSLHLMHHLNAWVPAVAIPLSGVRDETGPVAPHELVAHGSQLAAAFGLALARSWVRWMAPAGGDGSDGHRPSAIGKRPSSIPTVTPSDHSIAR